MPVMAKNITGASTLRSLGLALTEKECEQLSSGEEISIENRSLEEVGRFFQRVGRVLASQHLVINYGEILGDYQSKLTSNATCPGIKIRTINEKCGVYWRPPFRLRECCDE